MSVAPGDPSLHTGRRAVEEQWCARVRAAKFRFDLAVAQADQASQQTDTAASEMFRMMEQSARDDYLRELQTFTDIVVRGKLPGEG